jgi:hypothetical protein
MDRSNIAVHLSGIGEFYPPRIKTSTFHASKDVGIDCEIVELSDKRLHSVLQPLRKDEVVLKAFQIHCHGINGADVSRCSYDNMRLRLNIPNEDDDKAYKSMHNGRLEHGRVTPTRWKAEKGESGIGQVRLLEAAPTSKNEKLVWVENQKNLTLPSFVSLPPFAGSKVFALTAVQTTVRSSKFVSLKKGGVITVLTPDGLLSMTVPPNALTDWPQTDSTFSITMDTRVMEFEDENGQTGLSSPVVECQPSGAVFNESSPVSLVIPLPVYVSVLEKYPNHMPEVWVSDDSNSAWHPLLDSHGHTVHPIITESAEGRYQATFTAPHFTKFVVLFRNRVADLIGMVSLYRYLTVNMASWISRLMDMPDQDGRRLFTIRLDFLIDNADTVTDEDFRQLTPYFSQVRLPYGDVLVSLNSSLIQPAESHQFERRVPFYDDIPCSVQFECQAADGSEDMITPEMILAAVRISRQRGNGIFCNDPIQLKKVIHSFIWSSWN